MLTLAALFGGRAHRRLFGGHFCGCGGGHYHGGHLLVGCQVLGHRGLGQGHRGLGQVGIPKATCDPMITDAITALKQMSFMI